MTSSPLRKIVCAIFMLLSALMFIVGITLIIMYVNSAIVERLGEGDQSLLFWYLPLMLFGIICTIAGMNLYKMTRRKCKDR